jgi:hypothetical protein
MTDSVTPPPAYCPICEQRAQRTPTRYGMRDACCGLWAWDGKPLVSEEVHRARNHCHRVFDALWQNAETQYTILEEFGTEERERMVARLRRTQRNRAYRWLAAQLGLPEADAHMSTQADIPTLRRIYKACLHATPEEIRAWAKANPKPKRTKKEKKPNGQA